MSKDHPTVLEVARAIDQVVSATGELVLAWRKHIKGELLEGNQPNCGVVGCYYYRGGFCTYKGECLHQL